MALKTSMQFDTSSRQVVPITDGNNQVIGYQTVSRSSFSQKMMEEYEKAKTIGFAGTYEEYLMFRDFT